MNAAWTYHSTDGVELATGQGSRLADLRPHFHEDGQVCAVLSGSRHFATATNRITVHAGQAIHFAPAELHAAIRASADCACLNLYVPEATYRTLECTHRITRLSAIDLIHGCGGPAMILQRFGARTRGHQSPLSNSRPVDRFKQTLLEKNTSIAELASQAELSREAFSRLFSARVGLAPQAYRIVGRLNTARRLLKHNAPPATAAIDAGFSDQSHLSRQFKRAFGASPAAYQKSLRRSAESITYVQDFLR